MKKIVCLFIFIISIVRAHTIIFNNQTNYPLEAILVFDRETPCRTITIPINPYSPIQPPRRVQVSCCTEVIKIQRTDQDALNKIEYEYEQPTTDEGACIDTLITINKRSDGLLDIK